MFLEKKLEKITHFLAELKLIAYLCHDEDGLHSAKLKRVWLCSRWHHLCNQKEHRRHVLRLKKTPWKQTGALSRQYF